MGAQGGAGATFEPANCQPIRSSRFSPRGKRSTLIGFVGTQVLRSAEPFSITHQAQLKSSPLTSFERRMPVNHRRERCENRGISLSQGAARRKLPCTSASDLSKSRSARRRHL
jgi:hypothetical protein